MGARGVASKPTMTDCNVSEGGVSVCPPTTASTRPPAPPTPWSSCDMRCRRAGRLVEQCGYNQIEPGVDIVLCGKAPFLMLAATSARTPGSTPVAVANAAAFVSLRLSLIKDLAIAFGWPKRCR
jgi:hypothetical protein